MSLLRFFSLSVILTLFNAYAVDVYVKVPSGEVKRYETKSSINSETLIWDPTQYGDRPELKDGETFVIVTVEVAAGKSIGKYDFNLNGAQCIAMATTRTNFNPGNWEYIYGKNLPDGTQVQLLYISKKQKIYLSIIYLIGVF